VWFPSAIGNLSYGRFDNFKSFTASDLRTVTVKVVLCRLKGIFFFCSLQVTMHDLWKCLFGCIHDGPDSFQIFKLVGDVEFLKDQRERQVVTTYASNRSLQIPKTTLLYRSRNFSTKPTSDWSLRVEKQIEIE
jgi:hypothetical protein